MFSIGNIKPLSMIVGRNIAVNEMNIAVCCELVAADINNPNARQVSVNKMLSNTSKNRLPLTGTSRTKTLSSKMLVILIIERSR